ncbi:hypothetical protein [Actinomadura welshii]|uniref:hypothetical protein n=1 Tax=Actinomadura welshii TaxID=3103817 RepID=UPI003B8A7C6A
MQAPIQARIHHRWRDSSAHPVRSSKSIQVPPSVRARPLKWSKHCWGLDADRADEAEFRPRDPLVERTELGLDPQPH